MRIQLISFAILLTPALVLAQDASSQIVAIPDGWKCVDKVAPSGQKYQICSPPTGGTGTPFFLWSREPAPAK